MYNIQNIIGSDVVGKCEGYIYKKNVVVAV